MAPNIEGTCDPKFKRVRDAFAANFEGGKEVGASVAVTIDGKPVIDLWAGHTDRERTRPWTRDTIVNVYSTTKGLTAICAHRLVDQHKLDFDAPVAKYWPEFAAAGKAESPVRWLMSHRVGLPAIRKPLRDTALFDWNMMTSALAEQEPWWTPGTRHGYHALTFGFLVGEVVKRISGKSLGTFFRDELAIPLGLDAHIGLDAKHDSRTAAMIAAPPPPPGQPNLMELIARDPESVTAKTFNNPPLGIRPGLVNSREWRASELPAANGHTNARALAKLYGALARGGELDGYRVLSPESIARCAAEQSYGADAVLMLPTRFGMGFMLSQPGESFGPNLHSFGHPGAGGSLGFADPDAKVGFGYPMNQMQTGLLVDARVKAMLAPLYEAI